MIPFLFSQPQQVKVNTQGLTPAGSGFRRGCLEANISEYLVSLV
jgi:hypothetical protein